MSGSLHALQINGRAPFSLIGQVVGVSEQTVAQALPRPPGADVVVRVVGCRRSRTCSDNSTGWCASPADRTHRPRSAAALARRDDVSWVSLTGAGNEIVASLRARTQDARDELLLRRLPKTEQVLNLSAGIVMHRFTGRYDADWSALHRGTGRSGDCRIEPADCPRRTAAPHPKYCWRRIGPLIAALALDGRAPIAALAAAPAGPTDAPARRLDALVDSGAVYIDVDLSMEALGYPLLAMFWLTVDPQHLDAFGSALVQENRSDVRRQRPPARRTSRPPWR